MSCRNLETIITELARGQMLEASVKTDALAHMEGCKQCAARFADEQSLTAGLRRAAESSALMEAPARVEALLLSAFRHQTASALQPGAVHAPAARPRWLPLSIAAAAAILIVSALAVQFMPSGDSNVQAPGQAQINQTSPALPESSREPGTVDSGEGTEIATESPDQRLTNRQPSPRSIRGVRVGRNSGQSNGQIYNVNNLEASANAEEEITTDFLPLTYGSHLAQMGDGQVVRVELPRSALQSFGLPISAERVGERVKADVLLGHDGVARAIRFVR